MTDTPLPDPPAPASLIVRGIEAVTLFANPAAARRRRKAERQMALAAGRRALARLRAERGGGAATGSESAATTGPDLAPAARAIETLEAAVLSLDRIAEHLAQGEDLTRSARACADDGARALLAERYDELRAEIDRLARTAYGGRTNLLDGLGGRVEAPLDGRGRASIAIPGADVTTGPGGLALPAPETAFREAGEIGAVAAALAAARQRCGALAERFELEATLLAARLGNGGPTT